MPNDLKLPKQLGRLYAMLEGGEAIPIRDMHALLCLRPSDDSREMQQDVGPYIIRLNRKLRERGQKIVPGQIKRTYVLTTIE